MKAERKNVESDLAVDVFFSNLVAGRDGLVPEIGQDGRWWIGGRDTGVVARAVDGVNGTDGADGKSPNIGANGNWWLDGRDLGVKAKAPAISIGSNGHWQIDGVDTAVPSDIDSFLSKTQESNQSVAGPVFFNGGLVSKGSTDIRSRAYLKSNPKGTTDVEGWEVLDVEENAPRYICVLPRNDGARTKVVIKKIPEHGDMYVVFMSSHAGCVIKSSDTDVKFWWGKEDDRPVYETTQRCTAILHGWHDGTSARWYVHTIGD